MTSFQDLLKLKLEGKGLERGMVHPECFSSQGKDFAEESSIALSKEDLHLFIQLTKWVPRLSTSKSELIKEKCRNWSNKELLILAAEILHLSCQIP